MSVAPDDPCPCGSGKSYKNCHKDLDDAAPQDMLTVAFKQYDKHWAGNSSFYEKQGVYDSLANHLALQINPSRILDLGCGRGEGLVALRNRLGQAGVQIIGVDQNPECLAVAAKRFGLTIPNNRLRWIHAVDRDYDLAYQSNLLPTISEITLINSDFTRPDDELESLLRSIGPCDAVTLWFSGTHGAQANDVVAQSLGATSSAMVRMAAETCSALIAKDFLRSNGVLHIVNRGQSRSEAACRVDLEPHAEKFAASLSLSLQSFAVYPYREPITGDRISVGNIGGDTFGLKTYATSAIFRL